MFYVLPKLPHTFWWCKFSSIGLLCHTNGGKNENSLPYCGEKKGCLVLFRWGFFVSGFFFFFGLA